MIIMKKTTKILSIILIAVLALSALSSCGDSEIPDGYMSVSPSGSSFNLYVPKSWVDNSACGTASAVYSATDKSNVSVTCITADESFTTLEEYLVYADACLRESLPGYALKKSTSSSAVASSSIDSSATELTDGTVSSSSLNVLDVAQKTKLAGLNALRFDYSCTVSGTAYNFRQIVCLHSNLFYVFTYTAEADIFDSHLYEVKEIVSYISFR